MNINFRVFITIAKFVKINRQLYSIPYRRHSVSGPLKVTPVPTTFRCYKTSNIPYMLS